MEATATPNTDRDACRRATELIAKIRRQANRQSRREHFLDAIRKLDAASRSLNLASWCNVPKLMPAAHFERLEQLRDRVSELRQAVEQFARDSVAHDRKGGQP